MDLVYNLKADYETRANLLIVWKGILKSIGQ
jgi:hypothetical protein